MLIFLVPTGPPQNVLAQSANPTTLNLSWSPPVADRRNGLIQRYTISVTELETGALEQFNTTAESFVVSGRHPFYRYSYVVAAETIGLGPYSVASVIHMPEAGIIIRHKSQTKATMVHNLMAS